MANKFQQSVERLEAEERRQKADDKPIAESAQEENAALSTSPDISAYIRHDAQRVAKNKTFYLDAAVVDAVKRISQEHQMTESRLVNDILRGVFGL